MSKSIPLPGKLGVVEKLDLKAGDILHLKVGGDFVIAGRTETWIPLQADLESAVATWKPLLAPLDIHLVVTHHLIDHLVITPESLNVSTWPAKTFEAR